MTEYICDMNRLDWDGNSGATVRRGERFEMDDDKRAKILLDAGYILNIPEQPDAVEEEEPAQIQAVTDYAEEIPTRENNGVIEHKHDGVANWHPADREHKTE